MLTAIRVADHLSLNVLLHFQPIYKHFEIFGLLFFGFQNTHLNVLVTCFFEEKGLETELRVRNVEFRDMFLTWDGYFAESAASSIYAEMGRTCHTPWQARLSFHTWTQLLPVPWGSKPRQLQAHGTETRNIELFSARPFLVDTFAYLMSNFEADTAKRCRTSCPGGEGENGSGENPPTVGRHWRGWHEHMLQKD